MSIQTQPEFITTATQPFVTLSNVDKDNIGMYSYKILTQTQIPPATRYDVE